jgi:hypothetical protein
MRDQQPLTCDHSPSTFLFVAVLLVMAPQAEAALVDFATQVQPILQRHCYACHGPVKQKSGLRLDIRSEAFKGGDNYGPAIIAREPSRSPLIELVTTADGDTRMPPELPPLPASDVAILSAWVAEGAVWPDGVDSSVLEDRRDHWAFKPLKRPPLPTVRDIHWPRQELDRFILEKLETAGLQPAPEADRITWLRRVSFDLIGLPPTAEQVIAFANDDRSDAYARVVDELLQSPRYGERWAQHWLDVVRYADTHGYEVNTERPNAWPYRDYVIAAFNRDTPYDQFIREQIAGDQIGQDAATGFLITSSVLLPGQIGKDEPSIRLARQDSLDEIVVNIGQTFLGLSIGCARCHDHKFDPITAGEYYAMQAFIAGVEYGDRELHTLEAELLRQKESRLKARIVDIQHGLARFEPLASPEGLRRTRLTSDRNELVFTPRISKFIRFTIHDANTHPSLGVIEPCIDEFEIFTSASEPAGALTVRNVALASAGTKVTASGSRTSAKHRIEHVNDGRFGNSSSWMSDEAGRGWLLFELAEPTLISKIVWSRDRDGQFSDRTATAATIEAGESLDTMYPLFHLPPLRQPIKAVHNSDRFAAVTAKRLRFTIDSTNSLEPCIDELEVYDSDNRNIALATAGTLVTSSGDHVSPGIHELRLINDGVVGNSSSWMSNSVGKGVVILEFPTSKSIERVVWSRDRTGEHADRLATQYRIEVADASGEWRLVADSSDRRPVDSKPSAVAQALPTLWGLTPTERLLADNLLIEKQGIEREIADSKLGQVAFAGKFRSPDRIHLLHRGDPEQPKQEVNPAFLSVIGDLGTLDNTQLSNDAPEPRRRAVLAEWLASAANPLTARVMANRIWQGHFGVGLVETTSDFGRTGMLPSHPELLDWLAVKFIDSQWSVKQMHRLIVLSATYRQSSLYHEHGLSQDADTRLLWRFPSRRLEAEVIRDSMLSVSGQLSTVMHGPGFDFFNQRGGLSGFTPVEKFTANGLRRMIYAHKVRRERESVFGAFDCPDAGQSTARRRESTTPIQALNLFNSQFTIDQATAFAVRVKNHCGDNAELQIAYAFQLAYSRAPTEIELSETLHVVKEHGLSTLCRVLFNSNEFLFVP